MNASGTRLSEQAVSILRLIAEGRSYDQILAQHPGLAYPDIFAAAREALLLAEAGATARPSAKDRAKARHPRAYERWSPEEDAQLARLIREGVAHGEIGRRLGRQDGAIGSRLVKLGLVGAEVDGQLLKAAPTDAAVEPPVPGPEIVPDARWVAIRARLEGSSEP